MYVSNATDNTSIFDLEKITKIYIEISDFLTIFISDLARVSNYAANFLSVLKSNNLYFTCQYEVSYSS